MSVELLEKIFRGLPGCEEWHAHLLKFSHSKKNGTSYNCRRIELEPKGCMNALLEDIGRAHLERPGGRLLKYEDVREYDGTCDGKTVYRISDGNPELEIDLDGLFKGIADPDSETDPFKMKAQAYILCGRLDIDGESRQVKLISMNTPVTALKNKFLFDKGKFMELPKKVLNLRTSMDVVVCDRAVYFLGMSGETLFDMERAYRKKCDEAVAQILEMGMVSDGKTFQDTASAGQNPRRFAAFSRSKLELLKKEENRKTAADSFDIPLTGDKKQFVTCTEEASEKLVKVLCGKAMWDILEEVPVEVDGSKRWI